MRTLAVAASLVSLWGIAPSSAAAADDKDPAVVACRDKQEADPCETMKLTKTDGGLERSTQAGVCKPSECCNLDYSKGSPPDTVCGPCLACEPGAAAPSPTENASETPSSQSEAPRTADQPPPSAGNDKRGCNMGGEPPWITLLLVGIPLVLRRTS